MSDFILLSGRRELAFRSAPIGAPKEERLRVSLHNWAVTREMLRRSSRTRRRNLPYYDLMIGRLQRRLDPLQEKSEPDAGRPDGARCLERGAVWHESEIFTGREISYMTWFGDSKHLLFVDRDYTGQQPGSPIGIRDELYIAEVATGMVSLLDTVDSPFRGDGGPQHHWTENTSPD